MDVPLQKDLVSVKDNCSIKFDYLWVHVMWNDTLLQYLVVLIKKFDISPFFIAHIQTYTHLFFSLKYNNKKKLYDDIACALKAFRTTHTKN